MGRLPRRELQQLAAHALEVALADLRQRIAQAQPARLEAEFGDLDRDGRIEGFARLAPKR